jgi:hypothetical protein
MLMVGVVETYQRELEKEEGRARDAAFIVGE